MPRTLKPVFKNFYGISFQSYNLNQLKNMEDSAVQYTNTHNTHGRQLISTVAEIHKYVLYKLNKLFIRILFVTHLSTYNSLWIYFWWAHTLCAWYWRWFKVRNKCSILRNITSWTEKCKLSVQNDCKNQLARVCQRKQSRRYYLQEEHERQLKLVSICIRNNALSTRSN